MSITKISPDVVDFDAGITISTADNLDTLTLTSTDADASVGPILNLYRNSSSPADSDIIGAIDYDGRNDNSQDVLYSRIIGLASDVSDGTEDGALYLQTIVAGTTRDRVSLLPTETIVNDGGIDLDFRVESDNSANALFVQGSDGRVGIGTSGPAYGLLDIRQTGTGAQDRGLYLEVSPSSSGSNNNAALISVGNGNMTNTVMRIHHESPAANQKLLSLDTTGSNTEKFWVDEDGDALLTGGLFLGGSADANKLADYEQGTWTPSVESTGSATFSNSRYTKVGRMVTMHTSVNSFSNTTASTLLGISLPFTASNSNVAVPLGTLSVQIANITPTGGYLGGTNLLNLYGTSTTTSFAPVTHADLGGSTSIYISITYMAA